MVMFGLPAALVVLTLAAAQRAPSPEEQKAFVEGLRLYEAGDARGAERAWKAGYAAGHDPAFLVRIGEAQEKAGAPKQAAESYEQYLRESPDAADRTEIEARIRRLGPTLPAKPSIPTESTRESESETPGEMRLSPGTTPGATPVPVQSLPPATAPGTQPTTAPANAPSGSAGAERTGQTAKPGQVRDDSDDDLGLVENEVPRSKLSSVAWGATGVTVLLLGVAAFYGASAAERAGDANRLLTYADELTFVPQEYALHAAQFEEDVRVGQRDDRIAKGFLIAAGVTAVAATVLFIMDSTSTTSEGKAVASRARAPRAIRRLDGTARRLDLRPRAGTTLGMDLSLSWSF
jgi:hypothetical protein